VTDDLDTRPPTATPLPSTPTPASRPVVINPPTLCACCQTRQAEDGVCDECANDACATFGH